VSQRYQVAEVHTAGGRVEFSLEVWRNHRGGWSHRQRWDVGGKKVRGWEARRMLSEHYANTSSLITTPTLSAHRAALMTWLAGGALAAWKDSVSMLMLNAETAQDYAICSVALDKAHREADVAASQLQLEPTQPPR
jgi:hypothetical protein